MSNLAQSSPAGPIVRSHVGLYTNMNDTDAACQALSVDLDYGIAPTPVAPVVYQDPFETLDWDFTGSGVGIVAGGRNGKGLQVSGTTSTVTYTVPGGREDGVVVVGLGFKITAGSGVTAISSDRKLLEFRGAAGVMLFGSMGVVAGGSLFVADAAGVNRGGSPVGSVLPNQWYYAEVRFAVSPTIGEFALRLDGVDVAGAFDLNTGAGLVDTIRITAPNTTSSVTHTYDDFYLAAGLDATFIGPLDVPNGSLAWEMHQYDAGGATAATTASGAVPFNYEAAAVRLRLESSADGEQRFLLNGDPIAEATEPDPIVGTHAGFGASYETFTYEADAGSFTDDFERGALGADWIVGQARSADRTVTLPTISTGAAITTGHSGVYPSVGATSCRLAPAWWAASPSSRHATVSAGQLVIARVMQENSNGVPLSASTGWTQLGTATNGNPAGDFLEAFDNFGAWTTAGTTAIVATGRTATNGAQITGAGSSNHADFTLRTEDATVVVGFAFQINSLAAAASELVQFWSDTNATRHGRVTVNSNGSLSYFRDTTLLGAATAAGPSPSTPGTTLRSAPSCRTPSAPSPCASTAPTCSPSPRRTPRTLAPRPSTTRSVCAGRSPASPTCSTTATS